MPSSPPPLWSLVEALARAAATAPLPPALRAFWALVAWSAQQASGQQTSRQEAPPPGGSSTRTSGRAYEQTARPGAAGQTARPSAAWADFWGNDDPEAAHDLFNDPDDTPPSPLGPEGDAGARTVAAPAEWQGARLRAALASRDPQAVWDALGETPGLVDDAPPAAAAPPGRVLRRRLRRSSR